MAALRPRAFAPTRFLVVAAASLLWFGCSPDAGDSPTEPVADPGAELARGGTPGPPQELGPALAAQKRHGPALMRLEGVVGHGVGIGSDGEAGITVYTLRPDVAGIPSRLDGVPVRTVTTGMFVAGTTERVRPAPNGYSVGHPDITAGTLGAVVQGADDVCYVLSNNHVLANSNDAALGDAALQPGPTDGGSDPEDAIGTLSAFEPIAFDGSENTIDAAIAEVFEPDSVTGSTPQSAYGAPGSSIQEDTVGLAVQKFGRTTALTEGTVSEVNVTANVCYACSGPFCFNCTRLATFTGQMGISSPDGFSSGGDSGSLIVTDDGSANPVGLLFAGSTTRTLGNPIGDVLSAFSVSVTSDLGSCAGGDGDNGGDNGGGENQQPEASFTADPTSGEAPLDVHFDASASSDPDGDALTYSWNFGDGATTTGEMADHTYTDAGEFTVTLTVSDGELTDDATATIMVSEPDAGDGITLSATGYKVRGLHKADLEWSTTSASQVEVYRDGSLVATVPNDGFHTDNIDQRGSGTYTYQICEEGSDVCSNEATVSF